MASVQTRLPPEKVDCRWWKRGFCFRGSSCFFKHNPALLGVEAPRTALGNADTTPEQGGAPPTSHDASRTSPQRQYQRPRELCGICLETPEVYGLLTDCDHVFCLPCIRIWRKSAGARPSELAFNVEANSIEATKKCPVCRTKSSFVIPSSVVPVRPSRRSGESADSGGAAALNPAKAKLIENYLAQRKQIPCKFYQRSVERWREFVEKRRMHHELLAMVAEAESKNEVPAEEDRWSNDGNAHEQNANTGNADWESAGRNAGSNFDANEQSTTDANEWSSTEGNEGSTINPDEWSAIRTNVRNTRANRRRATFANEQSTTNANEWSTTDGNIRSTISRSVRNTTRADERSATNANEWNTTDANDWSTTDENDWSTTDDNDWSNADALEWSTADANASRNPDANENNGRSSPAAHTWHTVGGTFNPPRFRPRCKFGNDCHYAHIHPETGKPHIFTPEEVKYMTSRNYPHIPQGMVDQSLALWAMFRDENARELIEHVNQVRLRQSLSPIYLEDDVPETSHHSMDSIHEWEEYNQQQDRMASQQGSVRSSG